MTFRSSLLVLLLSAAAAGVAAQSSAPADGELRGMVRTNEGASVAPLPFAIVELMVDGVRQAVLADESGHYVMRGVAPGLRRVRALHVGHITAQLEVLIPAGGTVAVDLELVRQPVRMAALTVMTGPITLPDVHGRDLRVQAPAWAASEVALRTLGEGTGMAEAGMVSSGGGGTGGEVWMIRTWARLKVPSARRASKLRELMPQTSACLLRTESRQASWLPA